MTNEIYIGNNGHGTLCAEFHNYETVGEIVADLSDAGIENKFCFGEVYEIEYAPCDMYELIDALLDAAENKEQAKNDFVDAYSKAYKTVYGENF